MAVGRREGQEIDDVDDADAQLRGVAAQHPGRGERLDRRDGARAGEHDIGLGATVARGPAPDARTRADVLLRLRERQPLHLRLLAGDDEVDPSRRGEAVAHRDEQRVGVGGQVDARDVLLLGQQLVDEPRALMAVAVVLLAPALARQQVVQARDRRAPRDLGRHLQELRVLVDHPVDDRRERLVAREQAVPAGEQIALQPALAVVLGQDLHHAAVGREMLAVAVDRPDVRAARRLEHGLELVGLELVGADDPQVAPLLGGAHELAQPVAERRRGARAAAPGGADVDGVPQAPTVGSPVGAQPPLAGGARPDDVGRGRPVGVEQLLGAVGAQPALERPQLLGVLVHARKRYLMGVERPLDLQPADLRRRAPALARAQDHERPARPRRRRAAARAALDVGDRAQAAVEHAAPQRVGLGLGVVGLQARQLRRARTVAHDAIGSVWQFAADRRSCGTPVHGLICGQSTWPTAGCVRQRHAGSRGACVIGTFRTGLFTGHGFSFVGLSRCVGPDCLSWPRRVGPPTNRVRVDGTPDPDPPDVAEVSAAAHPRIGQQVQGESADAAQRQLDMSTTSTGA
jgi:hypothetical protein